MNTLLVDLLVQVTDIANEHFQGLDLLASFDYGQNVFEDNFFAKRSMLVHSAKQHKTAQLQPNRIGYMSERISRAVALVPNALDSCISSTRTK